MASDQHLVLRPAVALRVERYSALRVAEFDVGEKELADFFVARAALRQAALENEPRAGEVN